MSRLVAESGKMLAREEDQVSSASSFSLGIQSLIRVSHACMTQDSQEESQKDPFSLYPGEGPVETARESGP